MAQALARLVVDCSLVVKWKITTEDYAAEAEEIFSTGKGKASKLLLLTSYRQR